jgi:hypothetical protein
MVSDLQLRTIAGEFITASERLFVRAPVYRALSRRIADDAGLLALAATARAEQPAVLMLLGAVHYLTLRGADHPLTALYRQLAADSPTAADPFPVFRDFCVRFTDELTPLLARGRVQTNEVGRAAYLRLGLEWAAETFGAAPLAYVEIGASAGLNLAWDAFAMTFTRDDGDTVVRRGPDDSPVQLHCRLAGDPTPTERGVHPPSIVRRLGLEIDPPDLASAEARDWLLAFVWADDSDRLRRLRGAVDLARHAGHQVVRADAASALADTCAALPPGRLCVAHTFLLGQLPPPALAALRAGLAHASQGREVLQVGAEWHDHATQLQVHRWLDGAPRESRVLATGDAHGRHISWCGPVAP